MFFSAVQTVSSVLLMHFCRTHWSLDTHLLHLSVFFVPERILPYKRQNISVSLCNNKVRFPSLYSTNGSYSPVVVLLYKPIPIDHGSNEGRICPELFFSETQITVTWNEVLMWWVKRVSPRPPLLQASCHEVHSLISCKFKFCYETPWRVIVQDKAFTLVFYLIF